VSVFDNYVLEVVLSQKKQHFTGLDFEALRFQDSRHMKVVRLSVYVPAAFTPPPPPPPGNIPGTHFC